MENLIPLRVEFGDLTPSLKYSILWTPSLLILDGKGRELQRQVGFEAGEADSGPDAGDRLLPRYTRRRQATRNPWVSPWELWCLHQAPEESHQLEIHHHLAGAHVRFEPT